MTPMPDWALRQLIASASQCASGPLSPNPLQLIDLPCATRQARRFKLDVSFALRRDGAQQPRFSINDKGEPTPFRERIARHAGALGLNQEATERFFSLSPPGEVQTTLGVKWAEDGGLPQRVSLYLEELMDLGRAQQLLQDAFTLGLGAGAAYPGPPTGSAPPAPAALCIDYSGGEAIAFKDYWMALERSDAPQLQLDETLDRFRRVFPLCPQRGTRRYMLARRFIREGGAVKRYGSKLLWMSEAHDRAAAARAWGLVDAIRRKLPIEPTRSEAVLRRLRQVLGSSEQLFVYPDLVCLDSDAQGEIQGLLLYVSLR